MLQIMPELQFVCFPLQAKNTAVCQEKVSKFAEDKVSDIGLEHDKLLGGHQSYNHALLKCVPAT